LRETVKDAHVQRSGTSANGTIVPLSSLNGAPVESSRGAKPMRNDLRRAATEGHVRSVCGIGASGPTAAIEPSACSGAPLGSSKVAEPTLGDLCHGAKDEQMPCTA